MKIMTDLFILPLLYLRYHRYIIYYVIWLIISVSIINFSNAYLIKTPYLKYFIEFNFWLFLFIVSTIPLFIIINEIINLLRKIIPIGNFIALSMFSAGYLIIAYLFFSLLYDTIDFKTNIVDFKWKLIASKKDGTAIAKAILIYFNLLTIIVFSIFPNFIVVRFKTIYLQSYKKYNPIIYFRRLVPLAKTILQDNMKFVMMNLAIQFVTIIILIRTIVDITPDELKTLNPDQFRYVSIFITSWVTTFSGMIFPFIMGLTTHVESTIFDTYKRKITGILESMKGHTILVGFGDLGKIASKEIKTLKHIKMDYTFIPIPSDDINLIHINKSLLIVDKDEKLFKYVYSPTPDLKIGVAEVYKNGTSIYAPAIIGDINIPAVLEKTNFSDSSIIINVTKDENSTFSILDFKSRKAHYEKFPHLVSSFYRTSDKSFVITKELTVGEYFLYPIQLSGYFMGDILYNFLLKNSLPVNENNVPLLDKKILIIGEGKQLFFIIESLWVKIRNYIYSIKNEGSQDTPTTTKEDQIKKYFEDCVLLFTDSKYIHEVVSKHNKKNSSAKNEAVPKKNEKDLSADNDKVFWEIPVPRCLSMNHSGQLSQQASQSLKIPLAFGSPKILADLQNTLNNNAFEFIMLSYENGKDTLDVLHELLVIAERNDWLDKKDTESPQKSKKPHLIVSTRETEKPFVKNVISYWSGINQEKEYPRQYPEGIIDFYEGSKGMVGGLIKSLPYNQSSKKEDTSFEISLCLSNVTGAAATILGSMVGLSPLNSDTNDLVPSFHNLSTKLMENDKWCFHTQASLDNLEPLIKPPIRALLINANDNTVDIIKKKLESFELTEEFINPLGCPRRQVCSLYTYSRHFLSNEWRIKRNKAFLKDKEKYSQYSNFVDGIEKLEKEQKKLLVFKTKNIDTNKGFEKPLADIYICGSQNHPGVFAKILFQLMISKFKYERPELNKENLININFARSLSCYNMNFSYYKIFGELSETKNCKDNISSDNNFIDACVIYPITYPERWLAYSERLLERIGITEYALRYDDILSQILLMKRNYLINGECVFPSCGVEKVDCKILEYSNRFYKYEWIRNGCNHSCTNKQVNRLLKRGRF